MFYKDNINFQAGSWSWWLKDYDCLSNFAKQMTANTFEGFG
jgi:hypothetical protein